MSTCTLWDYDDPSQAIENNPPETYLSLFPNDTVYLSIVDIISHTDTTTGTITQDTLWNYSINTIPDSIPVIDTIYQSIGTISDSRKFLSWWGEDVDGTIVGYEYKWNYDTSWIYTENENELFYVPIQTEFALFTFNVRAVDNLDMRDLTPVKISFPIENSPPTVYFRDNSNPQLVNLPTDTAFTFPTRTFVWEMYDPDGNETITDIYYALDDTTCQTCWNRIENPSANSITLTNIEPGFHVFYLKIRDVAAAASRTIFFPDTTNSSEPDYWKVIPVTGEILLVDDFPQDSRNRSINWAKGIFDTLVGPDEYSVWEPGWKLPYSNVDVTQNLKYFNYVFWFGAYAGDDLYDKAEASIQSYILDGGYLFISIANLKKKSFEWFPMDTTFVFNELGDENYELTDDRTLHSLVDTTLDLRTPDQVGIYTKLKAFDFAQDNTNFTPLYLLQAPEDSTFDAWEGTPIICGKYKPSLPITAGSAILLSIPMHNAYWPLLDGNDNMYEFFQYILQTAF